MSLDDIWAEPLVETAPPPATSRRTSARPALFLSDSEGEDGGDVRNRRAAAAPADGGGARAPEAAQLDAMFAGLDDDDDVFGDIAPVDVEGIRRQTDATAAAAGNPQATTSRTGGGNVMLGDNEKDGGRKTKRELPKLDEERLLGQDGFPRLLKEYKAFRVTGKGNEENDLTKLFRIYHAWAHRLYPKYQFRDTVDTIEKLCRSRRMAVNLKVWRDAAHGVTTDVHRPIWDEADADAEDEGARDDDDDEHAARQQPPHRDASSPSSSRPSTPVTRPASAASTASSAPSLSMRGDDDLDIDALLREEEELMREMDEKREGRDAYRKRPAGGSVEEEDFWSEVGRVPDEVPRAGSQPETGAMRGLDEADDEDMWDIVNEMNVQASSSKGPVEDNTVNSTAPVAQATIGADWDDMYE